jgi:hypothetical protein
MVTIMIQLTLLGFAIICTVLLVVEIRVAADMEFGKRSLDFFLPERRVENCTSVRAGQHCFTIFLIVQLIGFKVNSL